MNIFQNNSRFVVSTPLGKGFIDVRNFNYCLATFGNQFFRLWLIRISNIITIQTRYMLTRKYFNIQTLSFSYFERFLLRRKAEFVFLCRYRNSYSIVTVYFMNKYISTTVAILLKNKFRESI